jgi:uncharacterized protein
MKLSKQCNLRCTYCYEFDELGMADRMALSDLEGLFAGLAADPPSRGWPQLRFVFHGGEPLLLPHDYLAGVVEAQERHLRPAGIAYRNSLQTNLTRLDARTIELLDRLNIGLGISLDVFGDQRVMLSGRNSQDRVLRNLQTLLDQDAVRRLGVGIISVLHRKNVARIVSSYEFCAELELPWRVLPVFSLAEPPARMAGLTLEHTEVLEALQRLGRHWLDAGAPIDVFPLSNYLQAALHDLLGIPSSTYDPRLSEWAYIVNTNGDVYSHAEAYSAAGYMGNLFTDTFRTVISSEAHGRSLEPRVARGRTCDACRFSRACSHVPLIESLSSERAYDDTGSLICPIAKPMIEFFREELLRDEASQELVALAKDQAAHLPAPA